MFLTEMMNWPIYVTDTGIIYCNQNNCPAEDAPYVFGDDINGRRVTFAELVTVLSRHMRDHKAR